MIYCEWKIKVREWIPYVGLIPKVIPLIIFRDGTQFLKWYTQFFKLHSPKGECNSEIIYKLRFEGGHEKFKHYFWSIHPCDMQLSWGSKNRRVKSLAPLHTKSVITNKRWEIRHQHDSLCLPSNHITCLGSLWCQPIHDRVHNFVSVRWGFFLDSLHSFR